MAYVDYYDAHGIIPVDQSFVDFEVRKCRRLYLLAALGVSPRDLANASVLELGPGTGDNAVVISRLGVQKIVLIDGSEAALNAISRRVSDGQFGCPVTIEKKMFHAFRPVSQYDVVIAEGCLPFQRGVREIFSNLLASVAPQGILVFTYLSKFGLVSELLRRVLASVLFQSGTFDERVALAADFFERDLKMLSARTRDPREWVQDAIFHPWQKSGGQIFTIEDVLAKINGDFLIMGTLPRPQALGVWYKSVESNYVEVLNEEIFGASLDSELQMLDLRIDPNECRMPRGAYRDLSADVDELIRLSAEFESAVEQSTVELFSAVVFRMCKRLGELRGFNVTIDSMLALEAVVSAAYRREISAKKAYERLEKFSGMWGRCQHYAALRKL
jgi:SAM-dependent methyltransferase